VAAAGVIAEGTVPARGRQVGYAVTGDPAGRPVVFCHDAPGSRLLALGTAEQQAAAGIRMVCVERPGFGLSERLRPGALGYDFPGDVDAVVRHLGIERYAVAGASMGGRYALACGAAQPEAVTMVGVIAGVLPPSSYPDDEMAIMAAQDPVGAETLLKEFLEVFASDLDSAVEGMAARDGPDGTVYGRPEVQATILAGYREAFRTGVGGAVHDALAASRPWGFELGDVTVPVRWWHGDADPVAALASVEEAIAGLALYELTVFSGEGHAVGFTHAEEILAGLR
jgi:pimeloyl-ACP methyl ester carboxylesterase